MKLSPLTLANLLSERRPADYLIAWRGTTHFTLQHLRSSVAQLAQQLIESPAKQWALYFEDSYRFAIALLALCYTGKIPVLLGHLKPTLLAEQAHTFDGLLTDTDITSTTGITIYVNEFTTNVSVSLPRWPKQQHLVLFTSGSTGKPKAIHKPIDLLELEGHLLIRELIANWQINQLISTVSHQHLYGLTFRIFLPLLAGIAFDSQMIRYHEQLQNYSQQNALLIASPAFLKRLDERLPTSHFEAIVSSGGALSYEAAQLTKQSLSVLPYEIYGTSETGVIATRQQHHQGQVWQLFGFNKLTQQANVTRIDTPLASPSQLLLSDNIVLLGEGFHLLGRQDKVVKIEEKRVSLAEVEHRLVGLAAIKEAVVIVLEHNYLVTLGVVLVLSKQGEAMLADYGKYKMVQTLRQQLKKYLESVAIPKKWRIVCELPHNTQGKLIYSELKELFNDVT